MGRGKGAAKVSKRTHFSFIQITLSLHFNYLRFTWNLILIFKYWLNCRYNEVSLSFFLAKTVLSLAKVHKLNAVLIFSYICFSLCAFFFPSNIFLLLISGMCCGQPMSLCRETCFLTINTESYATGKKERKGNNSDGFNGKVRISRKRRKSKAA